MGIKFNKWLLDGSPKHLVGMSRRYDYRPT